MQEPNITNFSSGGFPIEPDFPRSQIYISDNKKKNNQYEQKQKKFKLVTPVGKTHFYLVLTVGKNFTPEEVSNCQHKYNCYNCVSSIEKQIFFYPIQNAIHNSFICSPIPHCSPECCLRTITDLMNNQNLKELFFLLYGGSIVCAPPRSLLYVPGGYTIEEYHATSANNQVVTVESTSNIQGFLAPLYVGSCMIDPDNGYKMVTEHAAFIDECKLQSKISVAPERTRDNKSLVVKNLSPLSFEENTISNIFSIDPSSTIKRKRRKRKLPEGEDPFKAFNSSSKQEITDDKI
jgi:hypothetical protein